MRRDPAKGATSLVKAMLLFQELTERYVASLCGLHVIDGREV